jgi:hypothetical protein
MFEMTAKEYNNYLKRGFDPPMRCPVCRRNKHKHIAEVDFKHSKNKRERQKEWQEDKIVRKRKASLKNRSYINADW